MRIQNEQTAFPIEVLDRDGYTTDREVTVYIDFHIEVDNHYGADADGNRGERLVECVIDQIYVDPKMVNPLLAEELKQVLADAEARFAHMDKHW